MKKFDALVFIARAQPFHMGHVAVINEALEQAKEVIVVIGSSFASRNTRNPFTFEERKLMIKGTFPQPEVKVVPIVDYSEDDNKWIAAIQTAVSGAIKYSPDPMRVGLIGHAKDHTSYYLKIFPNWKSVDVYNYRGINATDIRNDYLNYQESNWKSFEIPVSTYDFLIKFSSTVDYKNLQDEKAMITKYKQSWASAPFPPIFVTVDAVVIQSGHILLGKRKFAPGKGLWCVPGGFLNQDELIEDGAIRELIEETSIKIPIRTLKRLTTKSKVFDNPNRGSRGRTITHAFFIDLGMDLELPKIQAADDIEEVAWVPFSEVRRELMFEDHYSLLNYFLNLS